MYALMCVGGQGDAIQLPPVNIAGKEHMTKNRVTI